MNDLTQVKAKMEKSVDLTRNDLSTIRTGRATPVLVEHIIIKAYGGTTQLKVKELATIATSDTKTLLVHPFDPSTKEDIVKGISSANAGLTPVIDGEAIRITIPSLSSERRQEYLKLAKAKLEAGRVLVRQVRHEEMANLKKQFEVKEITEDERKRSEKQLQELTDKMMAELDTVGKAKEVELMQL